MNGVRGDDAKLRALLSRLIRAARGELGSTIRRDLAKQTHEEIARAFRERRAPDGSAWKPVNNKSGSPLVASGALRSGFDVELTDQGVRVGNDVAYAKVHQHGGRIRRRRRVANSKTKRHFGARATVIPARPMVPTARWGPAPERRLRVVSSRAVRKFLLTG